ncbi:MAG: hypothetical protein ACRDZR_07130 [Acidimicrobiales bacterium]
MSVSGTVVIREVRRRNPVNLEEFLGSGNRLGMFVAGTTESAARRHERGCGGVEHESDVAHGHRATLIIFE